MRRVRSLWRSLVGADGPTTEATMATRADNRWREVTRARTYLGPPANSSEVIARQIDRLPALASTFYGQTFFEEYGWGPTLRELLQGTHDAGSPLRCLRGTEDTVLAHIYGFIASQWAEHVTLTIPASCVGHLNYFDKICRFPHGRRGYECWSKREVADDLPVTSRMEGSIATKAKAEGEGGDVSKGYVSFATCGHIEFPDPADRNVNMMPFVFGDRSSLPPDLQCYYDCIEKCPCRDEVGLVGYLTIHESYVEAGEAQRREGLHIESPGFFADGEGPAFSPGCEHPWGCGVFFGPDDYQGGIYMASSVDDTSEVWDALVDKNVKGIVDRHGGCEHLRRLIGPGTKLKANQLIWMTDCTPHEAIPQKTSGYRIFFRVVTSHISHWYADHSTPNPLVPLPDDVVVVHGSKFDAASVLSGVEDGGVKQEMKSPK